MRKISVTLFLFMLLCLMPTTSFAKKKIYVQGHNSSYSSGPRREPICEFLTIDVDQDSCELCITFTNDTNNIILSLTKNEVIYEEDELDAVTGQTVTYYLGNNEVGEYDLTIEVNGTVASVYTVIIEE